MKRLTLIFAVTILTLALVFTGCCEQAPYGAAVPPQMGDMRFGGMHGGGRGAFPNGSAPQMEADGATAGASELPAMDEAELFTKRDLDCEPDLSEAVAVTAQDSSVYTVSSAGIYVISGQASDFTVKVEAGKEDKVQIVLAGAKITNDNFPVIYVKSADKCFVTSMGNNSLSVTGQFTADGDINTDAVIFSKADLTLNGTGALEIVSVAANGIACKDDLKITGGSYTVTSARDAIEANDSISIYDGAFNINTGKDGFHCENDVPSGFIYIKNGSFTITAKDDGIQATSFLMVNGGEYNITSVEGMEATYVQINGGTINISASDDGINAARKGSEYNVVIEINGGDITVVAGPGDTDCIDSNGTIIVNGGTISLTGNSTFDSDSGSVYSGGTIIINGVVSDGIPASAMGGRGGKRTRIK